MKNNPFLPRHLASLARRGWLQYCLVLTTEMFATEMLAAFLCGEAGMANRTTFDHISIIFYIVSAILVGPLLEALLAQALVFELVSAAGAAPVYAFLSTWCAFALMHIDASIGTFLSAGCVGGFFLSVCYFQWRSESRAKAIMLTAMCHAINNALAMMGVFS